MPLYEFRCQSCEMSFEWLVRSMANDEKVTCPSCGSDQVHRELSVFAAHQGVSGRGSTAPPCGQCCAENEACPYGP